MHRHRGQNGQKLQHQRRTRSRTGHCRHLRRFLFSMFPIHRSHILSKKRTRPNIDQPIVIMVFSVMFPLRGKTNLTGTNIDERTVVNVPSGSLSTCTRICLRSRAKGISNPRAGIAAVPAVPLIVKFSPSQEADREDDQPDPMLIRECLLSTLPPEAFPPLPEWASDRPS